MSAFSSNNAVSPCFIPTFCISTAYYEPLIQRSTVCQSLLSITEANIQADKFNLLEIEM